MRTISTLKLKPLIQAFYLLLILTTSVASAHAQAEVAIERANPQRTGVYKTSAKPEAGEIAWESQKLFIMKRGDVLFGGTVTVGNMKTGMFMFSTPDFFFPIYGVGYSDPVVSGGIIYFSVNIGYGHLYAMDTRTGKVKWRATREKGSYSPPVIVGDTLYVGADSGYFYAVDIKGEQPQQKWRHVRGDQSSALQSPLVGDGTVFYVSGEGLLFALNSETGEPRWSYASGKPYLSSPALSDGTVYFAGPDVIYALESASGKLKSQVKAEVGAPFVTIANGLVYFLDNRGHLRSVDSRTGAAQPKPRNDNRLGTRFAIEEQTVYFGGWSTGNVYAVDAVTGDIKWKFTRTAESDCSAPVVVGDNLLFTCDDGRLYSLDKLTGKKKWVATNKKPEVSTPAIADGMAYFLSDDGKVYAVK
jgi:outer membrane protein assembly factor BamB